jgi:hypothetical protein
LQEEKAMKYNKPDWAVKQIVRASGLIENVCEHGIGHPNRDWMALHDPDGEKGFGIHGCDGCCCKDIKAERQKLFDAIKQLREGNEVQVSLYGNTYTVEPWKSKEQNQDGYCQTVLAKYHGKKIGIVMISWKDAGPNPRLLSAGGKSGFIPCKNIYGIVKEG